MLKMFSKACEYGIRSLIFITLKSTDGNRLNVMDIADEIDSPVAFTAKILQELVKGNILTSVKGPHGGFTITNQSARKVRLYDIVKIIDGDTIYNGCGLGLKECSVNKPCPLHDKFMEVRTGLKTMLKETTLQELAEQMDNGGAFLKL